jgi:hypothetical protein
MADLCVGSLVIGINNYSHEYYHSAEYKLEFAEADAVAFNNYLNVSWPNSPEANHIVLLNQDAEPLRIKNALVDLAGRGPFDLLFFYFAGHGERNGQNAWLCTVDAQPGQVDLEIAALDNLILNINAKAAILFIDCCYAESIISKSDFLKSLIDSEARLYICSARATQRTWEEKELGHGIFSYLLIKALSKGTSVGQSGDHVDVDRELFPYLCEQVPLLVIKYKKGRQQEPVKGGVSRSDVKLPTAETGFGGTGVSIYEVVRRRYRQALVATTVVILIAFLLIQVFFYHLAIDPTGRVVIRNGIRETFGFLPRSLGTRIDTGFGMAELSSKKTPENLAHLSKLQNGQIWGFWTQTSLRGYRSWIDSVTPLLEKKERERAILLLTGDISTETSEYIQKSLDEKEGAEGSWLEVESWRTKLVAESLLLNSQDNPRRIKWLLKQIPRMDNVDLNSSTPPKNVLNFEVLNLSSSELVNHIRALQIYALSDPTIQLSAFQDAFKLVSYRVLFSKSEEDTKEELLALGALFKTVCVARQVAGLQSITAEEAGFLNYCLDFWCSTTASVVLSYMGGLTDQTSNIHHLEGALQRIGPASYETNEIYPLWSIFKLADANLINADFAKKIFEAARRSTKEFQSVTDSWRQCLAKVSFSTNLPEEERALLFQLLHNNVEEFDFTPLEAFLLLAANYRFLDDTEKSELKSWLEQHAQKLKGLSFAAEAYAYLGISGLDVQKMASLLDERLLPELRIYSNSENLKPGFLNIVSDDSQHAAALGQLAQHAKLPDRITDRLYLYAVNRPDFAQSNEIFKGLAAQRSLTGNLENLTRSVSSSISYFSKDYYRKRVEVEIGIEQFLRVPFSERSKIFNQVKELWKNEGEPEVKIGLADIFLRAKEMSF